ncbi:MAG: NAD(P)H-binding protein [Nocardioidaceae bacterium]
MNDLVLVTGATGKTGAPLVSALAGRGAIVRAGVRHPRGQSRQVRFDWDDPLTWASAADGAGVVYLVKRPRDPAPALADFLDAVPWVRHVVLLSELGRDTKPDDDPERAAELAVDAAMAARGGEATILRPSWFLDNFGPHGGGWADEVRDRGVIRIPCGAAPVSWVDVRDVVDVAVAAILGRRGLGGVEVTGGEALTVTDLAALISAASGRPVRHDDPPREEYVRGLVDAGMEPKRLAYLMDIVDDLASGHFARVSTDVERVLGRPPRTATDYVAENARFWRVPRESEDKGVDGADR